MPSNKRITDLVDYTSILPYDSEMFGIYNPLLGWKSKRMENRFSKGLQQDKKNILEILKKQFKGQLSIKYAENCKPDIQSLEPGRLVDGKSKKTDSVVVHQIASKLPSLAEYKDSVWRSLLSAENLNIILKQKVIPQYTEYFEQSCKSNFNADNFSNRTKSRTKDSSLKLSFTVAFEQQLKYESAIAGSLQYLLEKKNYVTLKNIFYNLTDNTDLAESLIKSLSANTTHDAFLQIDNLDPQDKNDIANVALSPISVVHLFRQYFFELDSFLGTPVGHVWLSPGASAELIEVSTRKVIVEKTLQTTFETTTKAESQTTTEDEISEAVKQDNNQDIKTGASVTASYGSVTATANFDLNKSQQSSREETHRRMRQQTEKLSSEIRKNFTSTFKTVTENTDTSSKRYVLSNTTAELLNYEMRRKMRQVGVQVQDIGSYLCWQTYVDDPGKELGISKLIHLSKTPDTDSIPHPEEIPLFQDFIENDKIITIPFISTNDSDADNEGEVYANGGEVDDSEWFGSYETIQFRFNYEFVCPRPNYLLKNAEFDAQGKPVKISILEGTLQNADNKASFTINLDSADFQGKNSIDIGLSLFWSPAAGANDEVIAKNKEAVEKFKAKEKQLYEKTFVENAKDRVKLASNIRPRKSEDLREEERIVVYRSLIQDMLTNGIAMPDDRTRHVVAELINSIFDVDKMLYFVAPEWWRPRLHHSRQQIQGTDPGYPRPDNFSSADDKLIMKRAIADIHYDTAQAINQAPLQESEVGWGGLRESGRDNYYITEDSEPAKLGSSLGWLLQLDGDNMRNAFLNAPWVKTVIPIRPGKEKAAINWLKGIEGMNGIGDEDVYRTNNPEERDINGNPLNGQKLIDVIMDLANKITKKHEEANSKGKFPKADEVANPELVDEENTVTSTPIDRVYEHGFYALKDGFRANVNGNYEIFDQWIEVLPTDQIVPVPVKYDPRTGRQVPF